jgi:hypothetical protein
LGATSPKSFCPCVGAGAVFATGTGAAPYCSALTCSIQLAALPFTTSVMAMCVIAESGAAPCQCLMFAAMCTTSPTRISSSEPPQRWMRPIPAVTIRVWPTGCECHAVRAPGAKRTVPADARSCPAGAYSISTFTLPVKF